MNIDLTGANWKKSARSSGNGACVELANLGDLVAARDSKNPDGPVLTFPADALKAVVRLG